MKSNRKLTGIARALLACGLIAGVVGSSRSAEKFRELEYQLLYNNRPAGKATVMRSWTEEDTVKVFTTVELSAPVRMMLEETSLWGPSWQPIDYTVRAMGPQSATVQASCSDGHVLLNVTQGGKSEKKEIELGENPTLLDNNIISHFMILEMRYDRKARGRQNFQAAVPQADKAFPASLELKGRKKTEVGDKKMECEYFRGHIESVAFELWADPETHDLLRLKVPEQNFEAVLQKVS